MAAWTVVAGLVGEATTEELGLALFACSSPQMWRTGGAILRTGQYYPLRADPARTTALSCRHDQSRHDQRKSMTTQGSDSENAATALRGDLTFSSSPHAMNIPTPVNIRRMIKIPKAAQMRADIATRQRGRKLFKIRALSTIARWSK